MNGQGVHELSVGSRMDDGFQHHPCCAAFIAECCIISYDGVLVLFETFTVSMHAFSTHYRHLFIHDQDTLNVAYFTQ